MILSNDGSTQQNGWSQTAWACPDSTCHVQENPVASVLLFLNEATLFNIRPQDVTGDKLAVNLVVVKLPHL